VFNALQPVYQREAPELAASWPDPRLDDLRDATVQQLDDTGLFGPVAMRTYRWTATYDTFGYLRLLRTYSDHLALETARLERLLSGIGAVLDAEFGGRAPMAYASTLYVARLLGGISPCRGDGC
jgi:hypothetical protein